MSKEPRPLNPPVSKFSIPRPRPILAEYMADQREQDPAAPRRRPSRTEIDSNTLEQSQSRESRASREGRRQFSRQPSQRSDRTRGQGIPLNFLNLDDTANGTPEPNQEEFEASEQRRQWHAQNQQPWRSAMRRMSGNGRSTRSGTKRDFVQGNEADGALAKNVEETRSDAQPQDMSLDELRAEALKYSKQLKQKKNRKSKAGPPLTDSDEDPRDLQKGPKYETSRVATELYIVSYLIFFSIWGTLARLGLEALTFYPGAPVVFSALWENFGGSLIMGYLVEDRKLFQEEWGEAKYYNAIQRSKEQERNLEEGLTRPPTDLAAAKKAHGATKKTIPLYIGLATGFCGSFTTFSSFIRDCFLAISNDLPTPLNHPEDYSPTHASTSSTVHRNGGYSFMAVTAVILVTVAFCISGFFVGGHLALLITPYTPVLPFRFTRNILDRLFVILGWGCWIGAIIMTIFPPDSSYSSSETWRGQALFSIVFGPVGCLMRYYISLLLNPKIPSFPLGTFAVNLLGTAVLGMSWDLQHVPLGGVVGCQVLQGVEAGFCGCLTTISTWVSELTSLKKRHAYRYGIASVLCALGCMVIIMGSMRWTRGFAAVQCTH